jgi:ribonuclease J
MEIQIHRGLKEIGGNCIELNNESSRILLDFGMPLMRPGGEQFADTELANPTIENGVLPDIEGVYYWQKPSVDAVIFSHHHIDHVGLLPFIHPDIPVYISAASLEILRAYSIFTSHLDFLSKASNIKTFVPFKEFEIKGIEITPLLTDHSAFDACSLVIREAGTGSTLFYSGDLRKHGRKGKLIGLAEKLYADKIDTLLCEGTQLGRSPSNEDCISEQECENRLVEVCKESGLVYILCSASNIDRFVSIYKSCIKTRRTLVIDLFQLYLLEKLKAFSPALPPHENDLLKVFFLKGHVRALEDAGETQFLKRAGLRKASLHQILTSPAQYCLRLPEKMSRIFAGKLQRHAVAEISWVYSMWKGYLPELHNWSQAMKTIPGATSYIHCSGHFHSNDLLDFIKNINPKQLIPIHTLYPEEMILC